VFAGVPPGSFFIDAVLSRGAGWRLAAAAAGDRDLIDVPLVVGRDVRPPDVLLRISDRPATVSGTLLTPSGVSPSSYFVWLVPAESWRRSRDSVRMRTPVRPASDGSFRFDALVAGEYLLAVLKAWDPESWNSAAALEGLEPGAVRIRVDEGDVISRNISLVP
jgi:hypothetical protein